MERRPREGYHHHHHRHTREALLEREEEPRGRGGARSRAGKYVNKKIKEREKNMG